MRGVLRLQRIGQIQAFQPLVGAPQLACLAQRGWRVSQTSEADVAAGHLPVGDLYLNMCQGPTASEALLAIDQRLATGKVVLIP